MQTAAPNPASAARCSGGNRGPGAEGLAALPQVPGYRVLRQVGSGRRSTAWLAWDAARGAEVVLKLQPAGHATLRHEYEIAGSLAGESIVQVHEYGQAGSSVYLAMEFIPGGTLARRLQDSVTPRQALGLLRQAAEALARLHRRQLVHRDVKPHNFLLRADGRLVLADLGLVVPAGSQPAAPYGLFGTPRYVAPEQLQGAPAAAAADVYSLGVLLHEMLTGAVPFAGQTLTEVLSQHLVAVPPRLPAALAALQPLADRMLAQEAQCRLRDADAVLGLLAQRCLP
jgi:serine/threonine-protein kinase PpkA